MEQPDFEQPEGLTFKQELTDLLNKHGLDGICGVPDYIIANYLEEQYGALRQLLAADYNRRIK